MSEAKTLTERVISSTRLLAWARIGSLIGAITLPIASGLVWFEFSQAQAQSSIGERVTVIETQLAPIISLGERVSVIEARINAGQAAREKFQNDTTVTLRDVQQTQTAILEALAGLNARLDEKDRASNNRIN